jgi:hypothetical protein
MKIATAIGGLLLIIISFYLLKTNSVLFNKILNKAVDRTGLYQPVWTGDFQQYKGERFHCDFSDFYEIGIRTKDKLFPSFLHDNQSEFNMNFALSLLIENEGKLILKQHVKEAEVKRFLKGDLAYYSEIVFTVFPVTNCSNLELTASIDGELGVFKNNKSLEFYIAVSRVP